MPTEPNLVWGYNFGNADTSCIVVAKAPVIRGLFAEGMATTTH